jgi:endogenous inhibitor of DNA gyrase (YacG/DUF329 family)
MEVKCPTCKKMVTWENNPARPFCSERCQVLDFGAWAHEEFRVPVQGTVDSSEDEVSDPSSNHSADAEA